MSHARALGRRRLAAAFAAALVCALAPAPYAQASINGFEAGDGDQVGSDWEAIAQSVTTEPDAAGAGDSLFGTGSKENAPATWTFATGQAQPKADLEAAWARHETTAGPSFLYLALKRRADDGATFAGFELNQSTTELQAGVPCRTNSDLLLSYDITPNADVTVRVLRWVGTSGTAGCPHGATGGWQPAAELPAGSVEAAVNAAALINRLPGAGGPGTTFAVRTFGEAGLDLTAVAISLGVPTTDCLVFRRAQVRTRSSVEVNSDLVDRVDPVSFLALACGSEVDTGHKEDQIAQAPSPGAGTPGSGTTTSPAVGTGGTGATDGSPTTTDGTSLAAPGQGVLGTSRGSACRRKRFRLAVPGRGLRAVTFYVDGRRLRTVRRRDRRGDYAITIDPRRYGRTGTHTVTARLFARKRGVRSRTVPMRSFRTCSLGACVSRRSFRVRVPRYRGRTVRSATVYVNGRRAEVIRGKRLTARVRLTGLPKGRFKVRVRAVTTAGEVLTSTRTYRTCTKKRRARRS